MASALRGCLGSFCDFRPGEKVVNAAEPTAECQVLKNVWKLQPCTSLCCAACPGLATEPLPLPTAGLQCLQPSVGTGLTPSAHTRRSPEARDATQATGLRFAVQAPHAGGIANGACQRSWVGPKVAACLL